MITKRAFYGVLLALAVAGYPAWLVAQPPPDAPSSNEASDRLTPPPPIPPPEDGFQPVDVWMNHLKDRDPEAYGHFRQMRQQDPDGFRREMFGRLRRAHIRAGMATHPRLREFLDKLPEAERQEVLAALSRLVEPRGGPPPEEATGGDLRPIQEQVGQLARQLKQSRSDQDREALRAELKAKLGVLFDARDQNRRRHIERMETEMTRLKTMLDARREKRDEIIERRLRELTGEDNLSWDSPDEEPPPPAEPPPGAPR